MRKIAGNALALAVLLCARGGLAADSGPGDLAALDAEFGRALETYQSGDYEAAVSGFEALVASLESLPPSAGAEAQWSRALLRLAHARATLGRKEASGEAMETLLALEPDARPDPELYSPSFRREFERARTRVSERPHWKLTVAAPGPGPAAAFVGNRPIGDAPAAVELPQGRYRVSVSFGGEVATESVLLEADRTVTPGSVGRVLAAEGRSPEAGTGPAPPPEEVSRVDAVLPPLAATPEEGAPPPSRWMRPAGLAAGALALVSAGVAAWQGIEAAHAASLARSLLLPGGSLAPGSAPSAYAAAAASFGSDRRNAWIAGGTSLALSAGAALLLAWPDGPVAVSPGGAAIHF